MAHPTDVLSHEQLYSLEVTKGDKTVGASCPRLSGDLATPKNMWNDPFSISCKLSSFVCYKTVQHRTSILLCLSLAITPTHNRQDDSFLTLIETIIF
jgi:hypothetical protein